MSRVAPETTARPAYPKDADRSETMAGAPSSGTREDSVSSTSLIISLNENDCQTMTWYAGLGGPFSRGGRAG
jgi:hypothetical protein